MTTAVFAVLMLKKRLTIQQWLALVILVLGIVLVQLTKATDSIGKNNADQNRIIGISAALGACLLSGFAGVYFELILKTSDISVWIRNVQLSCLSIPVALGTCFLKDFNGIQKNGFFFGISVQFVVGATLVVFSIFMYNMKPPGQDPVIRQDSPKPNADDKV
ncbi:hypothetical protein LSTR_LSTR004187 [Laodelphax striatellus]|uniref:Uncharacterized protein n=1 Tax=Laodelphax striatellus TaxID=195883 RepID=A0A482X9N0_LAOST|nr:hypothetical protein LSTR_LSTR004187 [Laodelphax striatellus]